MLKFRSFFEIYLIAAVGACAAIIVDFALSAEGSLLFGAAQYAAAAAAYVSAPQIPLYAIAVLLIFLGASSVFYLRPLSRKGALVCGFAVIATLAILVP